MDHAMTQGQSVYPGIALHSSNYSVYCNKDQNLTHNINAYTVEPVYSDTPRDQGNLSDCQNTQVLFMLTELLRDPTFLLDVTGCRKTQVSDCTGFTVLCSRNLES